MKSKLFCNCHCTIMIFETHNCFNYLNQWTLSVRTLEENVDGRVRDAQVVTLNVDSVLDLTTGDVVCQIVSKLILIDNASSPPSGSNFY